MCRYTYSEHAIKSAKNIIDYKIKRRGILLKKYNIRPFSYEHHDVMTTQSVLLHEARAAKYFWKQFSSLIPTYTKVFQGRQPGKKDVVNRLLDIGYHSLSQAISNIFKNQQRSTAIGVLHVAQDASSEPLVYDLMELFRADTVDTEVLRFLRLKKQTVKKLEQKDIGIFLHDVYARYEKKFYLKDFKQCHSYMYYMELQVLKFISTVNHAKVFKPIHLPSRHDTRCS